MFIFAIETVIMILILGETHNLMIDEVCRWLNYYKVSYIRINEGIFNYSFSLSFDNGKVEPLLYIDCKVIPLSSISVTWFVRGYFDFKKSKVSYDKNIHKFIDNMKIRDFVNLSEYLYFYLRQNVKCYGYPPKYDVNKLIVLDIAMKKGLNVPNSIVTQQYDEFEKFSKINNDKIITKAISNWAKGGLKYSYSYETKEIEKQDIPKKFFYSLFQQQIEKCFEVRTFIWNNQTYSAAIYSNASNKKAKIDFRTSYDTIKIIPYKLPKNIEKQLLALKHCLSLESGSADFIVDNQMKYWFLEINPVGQFDFIDKYCNYNLAHIIAKSFVHYENKR